MPYIKGLESNFTTYNLSNATGFKSVYTWRLFELLKQFETTGICTISVNDFLFSMECSDYYSKDYSRLRVKVINPAIAELEEKGGILISLETKRKGRKISILQFTFEKNPQMKFKF